MTRDLLSRIWFKTLVLFTLSCLVVTFSAVTWSPLPREEGLTPAGFSKLLTSRVEGWMDAYGIPGAVIALVDEGELVWTAAFGGAAPATGSGMGTLTVFPAGDITQSLTAWGFLTLSSRSKVRLDSPISEYIGDWQFPRSPYRHERVTPRLLLSHTAGLPGGGIGWLTATGGDHMQGGDVPGLGAVLVRPPGEGFAFSSAGYEITGLLIEEQSRTSFAEFMRDEVLLPIGMHNSSFASAGSAGGAPGPGYSFSRQTSARGPGSNGASDGLFTTVGDLARYICMLMDPENNKLVPFELQKELYKPHAVPGGVHGLVSDSFGLGHYLEVLPSGKKAVSNTGQSGGYLSHFQAVPETGDGIVVLTNSERGLALLSYVLSDWAQWSGHSWTGMGLVTSLQYVLWLFIGCFVFIISYRGWTIVHEIYSRKRRFVPALRKLGLAGVARGVSGIFIMAVGAWGTTALFHYASRLFPVAAPFLAVLVFAMGLVLVLDALCPPRRHAGL